MDDRARDAENAKMRLSQEKGNLKKQLDDAEHKVASVMSSHKALEEKVHDLHSSHEMEIKVRALTPVHFMVCKCNSLMIVSWYGGLVIKSNPMYISKNKSDLFLWWSFQPFTPGHLIILNWNLASNVGFTGGLVRKSSPMYMSKNKLYLFLWWSSQPFTLGHLIILNWNLALNVGLYGGLSKKNLANVYF